MKHFKLVIFSGFIFLFWVACAQPNVNQTDEAEIAEQPEPAEAIGPTIPPEPTESPTSTPEPDLNTKLEAHYTFSGNANDSTANANHGTVNGVTLVEDRFGNGESAYAFDGIDDFIEVPHSQSIGLTFKSSVSAWVFVEEQEQPTWYSVIEKSDPERGGHSRWGIWLIRDRVEFCVQTAGVTTHHCLDSAEPVSTGEWHHFVGVWTGDTIQLYVDGALSLESTFSRDSISSSSHPLYFGTDPFNDTVIYTKMMLDDVRIYKRDLSAEEVADLYALESSP